MRFLLLLKPFRIYPIQYMNGSVRQVHPWTDEEWKRSSAKCTRNSHARDMCQCIHCSPPRTSTVSVLFVDFSSRPTDNFVDANACATFSFAVTCCARLSNRRKCDRFCAAQRRKWLIENRVVAALQLLLLSFIVPFAFHARRAIYPFKSFERVIEMKNDGR